jgi:hypothetical protein
MPHAPKSSLAIIVWIAGASMIAFVLYLVWVRPTAGTPFISDMGMLDPATHTQYEIDLDEIHRFWPVQIVPPSRFRSEHGIATYSWLAAEHKARSAVTVGVWFIIVGYAGWKQLRPNQSLQPTAGRSDD